MDEYIYRLRNVKTGKFVSPLKFKLDSLIGNQYKLNRYMERRKWNSKTQKWDQLPDKPIDIVEFKLVETGETVPVTRNLEFTKLFTERFGKK